MQYHPSGSSIADYVATEIVMSHVEDRPVLPLLKVYAFASNGHDTLDVDGPEAHAILADALERGLFLLDRVLTHRQQAKAQRLLEHCTARQILAEHQGR